MPPRGQQTPYDPELVRLVADLYNEGYTQTEIAIQLGTTQKRVFSIMRRHGIKARPAGPRNQKGSANNFWKGGRSISGGGYILRLRHGHPRATLAGYVFEHILVAEEKLGRALVWHGTGDPRSEIVHHIDGDKQNNDPNNLEITTFKEHLDHHRDKATGRNGGIK